MEDTAENLMKIIWSRRRTWGDKRIMEDYFSYTEKLFAPAEANQKPEALKGIRVLDFSHVILDPSPPEFSRITEQK